MRGALGQIFGGSAKEPAKPSKPRKRKRVAPVSVRVSAEERTALANAAGGQSMNAYLRSRLFGAAAAPSVRSRGKTPVKDFEALGRVLAALGRSGIPDALERLVKAQERRATLSSGGSARVDFALSQACADIAAMRRDLVKALGLKPVQR